MPSPELIDERFDEIVRELRALPGAPETLRKRVLERAEEEPLPRRSGWWSRLSLRRTTWTLATAAAGVVAVSLVYGLATSGTSERATARTVQDEPAFGGIDEEGAEAPAVTTLNRGAPAPSAPPPPSPSPTIAPDSRTEQTYEKQAAPLTGGARDAVTLPPGRRLAHYTASMRLRVSDIDELSRTTREAMRIARGLGGFVATVDYATPKGEDGDASLTLRVPAAKIQEAIAQLSDLGVIVSQQIKITDVQNRVNDDTDELARLRRTIRRIEARLKQSISPEERFRLELQLESARASLKRVTERRDATVRRARLATITVALTTREAEEKAAPPPGRIEHAARNAASLLAKEVAAVIYFLIAASPLILLGAAALIAARAQRRRFEQRLIEQA